jgi:hypothetical protein
MNEHEILIKADLIVRYGEVLTTPEATGLYEFISFCAPMVKVVRRCDGAAGYMQFTHSPRFYFDFCPD